MGKDQLGEYLLATGSLVARQRRRICTPAPSFAAGATFHRLKDDARGNLTAHAGQSYVYTAENLLTRHEGSATMTYDPALRLRAIHNHTNLATLTFDYDDQELIAEHDAAGNRTSRFVHGHECHTCGIRALR